MKPILPGPHGPDPQAVLGVTGGGQLGRMFAHAAQRMGYRTAVLDPDPHSPAGLVSQHHIQADYLDAVALERLAACCAAVTTEFENVPAQALTWLAGKLPVAPAADALRVAQDRGLEKAHFVDCQVACAPYALVGAESDLQSVGAELLPGILKTARLGYDGRGQLRVRDRAELAAAWIALGGVPCVLEKLLALDFECSVIVARAWGGEMVNFPAQRNLHRDGILLMTQAFAGIVPAALAAEAVAAAKSIAQGLQYVGVLCVEFFVLVDGSLVVNEIAPRPHNSGHYTIDACDLSQFDLQVRTLAALPITQPRQHSPAVMLNLLGDLWLQAPAPGYPAWDRVLALPGAHLHLYGKQRASQGRKMGHLTITGDSPEHVMHCAAQAARLLGIEDTGVPAPDDGC